MFQKKLEEKITEIYRQIQPYIQHHYIWTQTQDLKGKYVKQVNILYSTWSNR